MPSSRSSVAPRFDHRHPSGAVRGAVVAMALAFAVGLPACALAQKTADQPATNGFKPEVGQPGKDVVWVPTPQALVDRMLDMAKATPKDYVMDLGSGDGRTVITAAQRGIRAHGIEYNPDMVELAKRNAQAAGVTERATFEKADLFESDFSKAQVITMFLLPSINERLRPRILELAPGTRVVSNSFRMGDWEPDQTQTIDNCTSWCTAYLWIVPAKVEGDWRLDGQTLTLTQTYQMLSGSFDGKPVVGKVDGANVEFTAGGVRYQGTVDGKTMKGNGPRAWSAMRG